MVSQQIHQLDHLVIEYDVVGPVCESADFLGLGRRLPKDLKEGESIASVGRKSINYTRFVQWRQ